MAAIAQTTDAVEDGGRRFAITRVLVFSILFIVAGLALALIVLPQIPEGAATTLVFGPSVPDLVVPVAGFTWLAVILYIVGGIVGLLPLPERLQSVKSVWLIVNGALIVLLVLILTAINTNVNFTQTLQSSFRLMTPIAVGAIAGIWCERSGVVNIAIEGMMLTGACIGFTTVTLLAPYMPTQQSALWVGVVMAVLAGGLMAMLHAWISIVFGTNQVVSGTVINILALGLTSFIRREVLLSNQAGRETLQAVQIPVLSDIPIVGEIFFQGKPIYLMMFVLIIVTHVVIYFTRWGLRTRAIGENPHAADTLGVKVNRMRWINVTIGGLIAGLGGAWFSLEFIGTFEDNMIGGLGFIALAAAIFGKWTPFGAALGALLFGFSQALNVRFQIASVPIPPQFVQMIPYILTIVILAGVVGRAVAPKASGIPYRKE